MSEFFTNEDSYESTGGKEKCPVGQHVFEVLSAEPKTNPDNGKRSVLLMVQPASEDGVEYWPLRLYLAPTREGTDWSWTCSDIGKMIGPVPRCAKDLERAIAQLNKGGYCFMAMVEMGDKGPNIQRNTIKAWGDKPEANDEEVPF